MKRIRLSSIFLMMSAVMMMVACDVNDQTEPGPEYLDVNVNNISGNWELVQWNGSALQSGTYVFLELVRKEKTYTMWQNLDSFKDIPHVVTGTFSLYTDEEYGAVIRGNYDHSSGDWSHRYVITELTKDSMVWTAKDDPDHVQTYHRVENIPVR